MLRPVGFRSTSRIASLLLTATAFAWIAPAGPIGGEAKAFAQSASKSREDVIKEGTVALEVAKLAEQKGRHDVAAESALIALESFESAYGKSHPKTREAAEVLERIVRKMGRKDVADEIKKRFLTSSSPSPSPTPTPTPTPSKPTREEELNQVLREAVKAGNEGRDADSARAFERLLAMLESDGKGAEATGRGVRSKLAFAYDRMLQFSKAEPLLRRNVELAEAARPQDQSAVDDAREALALHFLVAGQHDRSLALYEQVLRSKEGSSRVGPADMAMLMLQMAGLQQSLDHHDESKRYVDRAMKIAVEGSLSGPIVQSISLMAGTIYSKIGEYEDAGQLLEAATAAAIRMDSGDGRTLDTPLSALAWHYRSRGKYEDAEKAWLKVLQLRERNRSSRSSDTAMTLNQLAELYWVWGKKTDQIMPMALRASDIDEANVASVLQGGSEEQKAAFIERYVQGTDRIVSYHLRYAKGDVDAARLAMNTVLRRKGRVLDAVSDGIRLLRQRMSGSDRDLLDKVGKVRERLASLSLAGPPKGMSPDEYRSTLASLEREELQLQTELAGKSASYRAETEPTTFEKVRALLPADAALVDIVAFRPFDVKYRRYTEAFGPKHYAAYVLRKDGAPQAVDLGEVSKLDAKIKAFREALASPMRNDVKELARELHDLVFAPVRSAIGDATHVLVSPDGMLNLVPFAAMADASGKYLVESYTFTYVTSGRDLIGMQATSKPRSAPLVVGNPDFDAGGAASAESGGGGKRSVDFVRVRFGALPGTRQEVESLAKVIEEPRMLQGASATEQELKKLEAPVVLHVATHGFFLADEASGGKGARALELDTSPGARLAVPQRENPLIRSGLALAGANSRKSGSEDGVLTALEVAGLDLYGTRMVVLSACETGVGEVRNGDGVYGLRRALVIAGSESQVMSLWKVDDEATRDLMVRLYDALEEGKGRSEALRAVQRGMAADKQRAHPYYWAAFIPSGKWEPMRFEWDGRRTGRDVSDSPGDTDRSSGPVVGAVTIGLGYDGLSASATAEHPQVLGRSLGFSLGFPLLAPRLSGRHFGLSDAVQLGAKGGAGTAEEDAAYAYDPSGLAWGLDASYTAMLGVRGGAFGLYAGARAMWLTSHAGDVSLSGSALPLVARVNLSSLTVTGWTGSMTGSRHVKGIDVSVPVKREDSGMIAVAGGWQEIDLNGKAKPEDSGEVDLGQVRASMLSVYLRATVY